MDFTLTRKDLVLKSHFIIFNEQQYLRPSISFCPHILLENTIFPLFWRDGRFILKNCKSGHNSEEKKDKRNSKPDQFIDKFFNQTSNCQEQKVFKRLSHLNRAKTIERLNWITISKAFDTKYLSKQP